MPMSMPNPVFKCEQAVGRLLVLPFLGLLRCCSGWVGAAGVLLPVAHLLSARTHVWHHEQSTATPSKMTSCVLHSC